MAYMSQEKKKEIEALVKPIFKKYGVKGRLGVDNHSTLVCNITSGSIDFVDDSVGEFSYQINEFHYDKHFKGKALDFFNELVPVLNKGNHDNSDYQSDYFDVGWYVSINVGKWNKPYTVL